MVNANWRTILIQMELTTYQKEYVKLLCYDRSRNSLPFLLFIVLSVVVLTNICLAIQDDPDVDVAMEAVKDIFALLIVFLRIIEHSLNPQRIVNLVQLINDDFLVNKNDFVESKDKFTRIAKLHEAQQKTTKKIFQYLKCLFLLIFCGFLVKHLFNDLMGIAEVSDESRRWLTPFLIYRVPQPSETSSTSFFVYAYCLHGFFLLVICLEGFVIYAAVCLSTEKLLGDFETFYVLLECLTNDFSECSGQHVNNHHFESILRKDLAIVIGCHQNLNRKFKICAGNSALVVLASIIFVGNDSFFNAYFMLKNDKLRKHLAGLPWTDKPRWFRQNVHIMMTRANVDTEMRPYGIFILNYMSFKDLMRLTFSVGNLLYTKKLAKQSQQ
ncbi:uncharacterized protein LOC120352667 isoform X2 [Nilaparvata lugens]|uniref:uncharacterized protein LOC120352667 isoform X2 n=1 Tax=Nilaparvata lugens TaxID=108931 RepID=UPI00193E9B7D|nr:uncharacterized protein LOC120352667 isoform X2 [Nilaparvata lugens]